MSEQEVLDALSDADALACTMHAEAAGDRAEGESSLEERIAVGCVIRNRLRQPLRFGDTYKEVCVKERQFSCWIAAGGAANYTRTLQNAYLLATRQPVGHLMFEETQWLAAGIVSGKLLDMVRGATHYFSPRAMQPPGSMPPWAKGREPVARVGGHLFFNNV